MKILHTADWHLGIDLNKVSLLEDQLDFFQQMIRIVEEENVDVILIAGDVYDTTLANREAIQLFDHMMTTLCVKMKKEVIVIAGNHDSGERLASMNQLLAPMGLHIYGKMEQELEPLCIQDCAFYPIPYFHLDTIRRVYGEEIRSLDEAFLLMLEKAKASTHQMHHIAIAHTFCQNATISESDRFANVGGSDLVSAEVFSSMDYTALGHLHRPQKISETVYYSGSPLPYSFSEAMYEKKVMIYDTQTKEIKERLLTPFHALVTLSGTFEELQEQVKQLPEKKAYYKIEMKDEIVSYETMEYFREHVPYLLQLTGKNAILSKTISIEMDQMEELNDMDIIEHFFMDHYGESLDEEEKGWILEAEKEKCYAS